MCSKTAKLRAKAILPGAFKASRAKNAAACAELYCLNQSIYHCNALKMAAQKRASMI
jgi:hypothetical protein